MSPLSAWLRFEFFDTDADWEVVHTIERATGEAAARIQLIPRRAVGEQYFAWSSECELHCLRTGRVWRGQAARTHALQTLDLAGAVQTATDALLNTSVKFVFTWVGVSASDSGCAERIKAAPYASLFHVEEAKSCTLSCLGADGVVHVWIAARAREGLDELLNVLNQNEATNVAREEVTEDTMAAPQTEPRRPKFLLTVRHNSAADAAFVKWLRKAVPRALQQRIHFVHCSTSTSDVWVWEDCTNNWKPLALTKCQLLELLLWKQLDYFLRKFIIALPVC